MTDDEIDELVPGGMAPYTVLIGPDEIRRFARRIEAAVQEKERDARQQEDDSIAYTERLRGPR